MARATNRSARRFGGGGPAGARDSNLTEAMSQPVDPMRLMQRVASQAERLIEGADGALIALHDAGRLNYVCGSGRLAPFVGTTIEIGSSLSGLAVSTRQVLRTDNTDLDPRVDAEACRRLGVLSSVCIPPVRGDAALGVLNVSSSRPDAFTDNDVEVLTRLSDFVSVAIGLACDLTRISDDLNDAERDRHRSRAAGSDDPDSARRFVMTVLNPAVATRAELRERIESLLDSRDSMSMVFQPIVDLTLDTVVAVEALARFHVAPARTPDKWFGDAHLVGLGVELEMAAASEAFAVISKLADGITMSINLGPQSILSGRLLDMLTHHRDRIVVELTEHTRIDDYSNLTGALRELRRLGTRLAVDDTGSGVSSLAHILKLAPDFIKLDRDLTNGIDLDPVRRALASSLVTFAGETGARIVAEGVETRDELDVIRSLGVRYAQGYYLGRAVPLADLAERLLAASTGLTPDYGARPDAS
ncbi:MAG TPA: EAL domain-containing protein [Acidimicrobiales bacterium]|jgi:EAL domain-containing protein (putative c-di-GMP-specific phosphodiesterase class I)|nr:EAL domain-containing protein [Acidimicrobiales bacterium]